MHRIGPYWLNMPLVTYAEDKTGLLAHPDGTLIEEPCLWLHFKERHALCLTGADRVQALHILEALAAPAPILQPQHTTASAC